MSCTMPAVFLLVLCLSITSYSSSLAEDVSSWGTDNMLVYRTSQPEVGQQLEVGCVGTWLGVQSPDSCRWVGPRGDSWTVADGQVRWGDDQGIPTLWLHYCAGCG